jgi:hypothetical protein
MSYNIILPNGTQIGTIPDGTVDDRTTTSLQLVGRNYSNYGQYMVNDLIDLLVNFAYNVAPTAPQNGQLWYNTSSGILNLYTGTTGGWIPVGTAQTGLTSGTPTISAVAGSLFLDTGYNQFYVCTGGANWILVGPQRNGSGAIWEQLYDAGLNPHDVVSIYLDGVRTAVISSATFTANATVAGLGTTAVNSGYNMNPSYTVYGTANNASYLGNQPAANYFTNYLNNVGTGSLTLQTNVGITLGSIGNFTANVHGTTGTGQFWNTKQGANISIHVSTPSGSVKALAAYGADGLIYLAGDPTGALGATTKQYVDAKFTNTTLLGVPTAPNPSAGDDSTQLATTHFVTSGLSGLYSYKIYKGSTWYWTDTASANLVVNGTTVMTASPSGLNLYSGATAVTQAQTYQSTGNSAIATTQYVNTATTWWGGSAKFVSNAAPIPGVNDIGSNNGDFWFQTSS